MKTVKERQDQVHMWQEIVGMTERIGALEVYSDINIVASPLQADVHLKPKLPSLAQSKEKLDKHAALIAEMGLNTSTYLRALENTKSKILETYWEIVSGVNSLESSFGLRDEEQLRQICRALELRYELAEEEYLAVFLRCGSRQSAAEPGSEKSNARTDILQHAFLLNSSPNDKERDALAAISGLTYKQVTTWFQNRRQRAKTDCTPFKSHATKSQARLQEPKHSGKQTQESKPSHFSENESPSTISKPSDFFGLVAELTTDLASSSKGHAESSHLCPPTLHRFDSTVTGVSKKQDASLHKRNGQPDEIRLPPSPASRIAQKGLPVKPEPHHRQIALLRASPSGPSRNIKRLPKRTPTGARSILNMSSSLHQLDDSTRIPSLTRSASSGSSSSHEYPSEPRDTIQESDAFEVRETPCTRTPSGASQYQCREISFETPTSFKGSKTIAAQPKRSLNTGHAACGNFSLLQESQNERTMTAHHSQPGHLPSNISASPIRSHRGQHVITPKRLSDRKHLETLLLPTNVSDNPVAQNHLQVDILPKDGTSPYDFTQVESLSLFPSLAPITSPDSKEANAPQQFHFDGLPFAFDDPPSQDFVLDDQTLKEMEALFNLETVSSEVDASQSEPNQSHDVAVEVPSSNFKGPYTADSSGSEELMITPSKPPCTNFLFTREDATVKHFEEQAVHVGKSSSSDANLVSLHSTGTTSFANFEGQVMDFAHQMHDWESGLLPFDMPGAIETWH